jgi:hypothetical protein
MNATVTRSETEIDEGLTILTVWLDLEPGRFLEDELGETFPVTNVEVTVFASDDILSGDDYIMVSARGDTTGRMYCGYSFAGLVDDDAPAWLVVLVDVFTHPAPVGV